MPGTKGPNLYSLIANPGWETGSRASSQPGVEPASVVVVAWLVGATVVFMEILGAGMAAGDMGN